MVIVGKTEDNRPVVAEVFKMYDTAGLPLSVLFDELKDRGIQPCWISFYEEALKAGWKDKTIESRLSEALTDCYGSEYRNEVFARLKQRN